MTRDFNSSRIKKWSLLFLSFFIVAFGQPMWSGWIGLIASIGGFACFWKVLLEIPLAKTRFYYGLVWFSSVQMIQFAWFLSHPYWFIFAVYFFCVFLLGIQWGILCMWIKREAILHLPQLFALAGLWTIFEWSRLFILSGLPFNPLGLYLSGSLYPLQFASLGGVYGLSFWVMLTNVFFLRAWIHPSSWNRWIVLGLVALVPYGYGFIHLAVHEKAAAQDPQSLKIVLVQSALPIEENMSFQSAGEARQFVLKEWRQILKTLVKQTNHKIDLIAFPEYLVPYGTYHHIFPIQDIHALFQELFGDVSITAYPQNSLFVDDYVIDQQKVALVSNAYIVQTIANLFHAHVVIGLEDSELIDRQARIAESYSAAFHFVPNGQDLPARYEKQILVPMGEYIPFSWCKALAARYGIRGSFTSGKEAKLFYGPVPFGTSICYEEIYGNLMRQNRQKGAMLLVNLTNDGWYPHSQLPRQHFDHARLRTVENGIPLARACNTGITGGIDSFGRITGILGDQSIEMQDRADSILLNLPLYSYSTFYTLWGDFPIIGFAWLCLCIGLISIKLSEKVIRSPRPDSISI